MLFVCGRNETLGACREEVQDVILDLFSHMGARAFSTHKADGAISWVLSQKAIMNIIQGYVLRRTR